jgi:hypothetical protein
VQKGYAAPEKRRLLMSHVGGERSRLRSSRQASTVDECTKGQRLRSLPNYTLLSIIILCFYQRANDFKDMKWMQNPENFLWFLGTHRTAASTYGKSFCEHLTFGTNVLKECSCLRWNQKYLNLNFGDRNEMLSLYTHSIILHYRFWVAHSAIQPSHCQVGWVKIAPWHLVRL